MNKLMIRCASFLTAASLLPLAALDVSAADRKKMVVIGDSVTAGTGLTGADLSCVDILSSSLNADVVNLAADKADTAAVLASLDRPEVKSELATADYIVVSAGVHDIMDPFAELADTYREQLGFEKFSDLYTASSSDIDLNEDQLGDMRYELSQSAKKNRKTMRDNILAIGEKLSAYRSAQVIALNVYNPLDTLENLSTLSAKRQDVYISLSNAVRGSARDYANTPGYAVLGSTYGFTVVDCFTAFGSEAYKYAYPTELVCYPTPLGHRKIAETAAAALDIELMVRGDVNGDFQINASDASLVLIHAAAAGTGDGTGTLTGTLLTAGDVNGDGEANASDAAQILTYAAVAGTGGKPAFHTSQ